MNVVRYKSDEIDMKADWRNKCESQADLIIRSFIPEEYLEERNNPNIVCDVHYRNFENVFIDCIKNDFQRTAERIVDNIFRDNQSNPIHYEENEIGSHTRRVTARAENRQNQERDGR